MSAPHFSPEQRMQQAEECVSYYEMFVGEGHTFRLGLYMATQWRNYLRQPRPDLNELRLFAEALRGGADTHGSVWHFMTLAVGWWLDALEETATP